MQCDRVVAAALASTCDAERQALIEWVSASVAPPDLVDLAQAIKSQGFDPLLNTDLVRARRIATLLYELGNDARSPAVTALGLLARGDAARQGGDPVGALGLHERAGATFLAAGDRVGWARARAGWLIAATHAGTITTRAVAAMAGARKVLRAAGMRYRLAVLEQNIGLAYRMLGHCDAALAAFERSAAAIAGDDSRAAAAQRATLLANTAEVHQFEGQFARALSLHQQAYDTFARLGYAASAAREAFNIAVISRLQGCYRESIALMQRAIDGFATAGLAVNVAGCLINQAETLMALNRLEEAAQAAEQAVSMMRSFSMKPGQAMALQMLGRVLLRKGAYADALPHLAESANIAADAGYWELALPVSNGHIALLLALGELDAAQSEIDALLASPRFRVYKREFVFTRLLAAEAQLARGNLDGAARLAHAVSREGRGAAQPQASARADVLLARVARQQGRLAAACASYDGAIATMRALAGDLAFDQRAEFLLDKDNTFLEALESALDAGEPARALAYLEQERARPTWGLAIADDANGRKLADLRRRHRAVSASLLAESPGTTAYGRLHGELRRLGRAISDTHEALAERRGDGALLESDAANTLPTGMTVLAWALLPRDLVIFVVSQGNVTARRLPGGATALRKLDRGLRVAIDGMAAALQHVGSDELRAVVARWDGPIRLLLGQIWARLIAPVSDLLPPDGAPLALAPHDVLHALPLAALWDGQRFLIERWPALIVPSCQALAAHQATTASHEESVLALGYDHAGLVPQASAEALRVAQILGGTALVGSDATCDALARLAPRRRYVHVAAHGAQRLDAPGSSFVQLADGPFHGSDALELALDGCRLVTLSACQTGLGRQSGGDEQIGLVRSLGIAGAGAVLATLWRVDDASTAALMECLYAALAAGATPAEALRHAQIAFAGDVVTSHRRHPFFWGGFQLVTHRPSISPRASDGTAKESARSLIATGADRS